MLLLAVLIAVTIQTTAQYPAPTRPGTNSTVPAQETPKQKAERLKLEALRAALATARTTEEWRSIHRQILELSRLKEEADRIAREKAQAEKDAARRLAMARMNAASAQQRAEFEQQQRAEFMARRLARAGAQPGAPAAPAVSPEPAPTATEPTPVQARHWSDDIPLVIYMAFGLLGLALIAIWILFPLMVYRYLRQLVVAQEQTNKLLIIQLEQTRQSLPPSSAGVGAETDQQAPDHPSGKGSTIFTTEI